VGPREARPRQVGKPRRKVGGGGREEDVRGPTGRGTRTSTYVGVV
jgi:hypothetical protein